MSDVTLPGPDDGLAPWTLTRGDYTLSTDPAWLDLDVVHGYIDRSYWAAGRPRAIQARAMAHSLNFGLYHTPAGAARAQVGFARVISDYTTYAYLADVFVLEEHRGQALGKWLIGSILAHPGLATVRRWALATWDAHGLYAQFGFTAPTRPEIMMEMTRALPWAP